MSKSLILVRGLSGSGKTWLADMIVGSDTTNRTSLCADDYFYDDSGKYEFDHTKLREAHEWCISETRETMQDGVDVICLHNNFTRKWEAEPYFKMAEEFGYQVQVISLYDSGKNDKDLADRSPHDISERAIQKQRQQWELDVHPHRSSKPKVQRNQGFKGQNFNGQMPYVVVYDQAPPHMTHPNHRGGNRKKY